MGGSRAESRAALGEVSLLARSTAFRQAMVLAAAAEVRLALDGAGPTRALRPVARLDSSSSLCGGVKSMTRVFIFCTPQWSQGHVIPAGFDFFNTPYLHVYSN